MKKYLQTSIMVMACALPVAVYPVGPVFAAESTAAQANLEKLVKTKSCKGCDLSGLILNRLDLVDADLEGADLSSAKLSLTNLTRANLKNTNLRGAVFGGTDLSDADLRGADLRGTSLDSSYHQGARFDGEFIVAKPDADVSETEVAKEVFVSDTVKPKQSPETREAKVSERRDLEGPSPTIAAVREVKPEEAVPAKPQGVQKDRQDLSPASLAPPPAAKKVAPVQQAIVEAPFQDEKISTPSAVPPIPVKEETKKQVPGDSAITPVKNPTVNASEQKEKKQVTQGTAVKAPKTLKVTEEKPIVEGGVGALSQKPPSGKPQQDNLSRLLDKNRCYGCDLSGLDLSGKNLDSADLEKANLTGCNLEKTDLDKANLKSALLVKANLRQASLKKADFYKADLTGADLTGAKVAGAMFDSAQTAAAVGLKEAIGAAGK